MKKYNIRKQILSLVLGAALAAAPCLTAYAGEPDIPIGEDISDYDPETDGYYALLPIRYEEPGTVVPDSVQEKVLQDVYFPVLVIDECVMARLDLFAEISGLSVNEAGDIFSLEIFDRQMYLGVEDPQVMYTVGKAGRSGKREFGRVSFYLSHAPVRYRGDIWVPFSDLAVFFGMNPHTDTENRFVLYRIERDGLDALAELAADYENWLYYYASGQIGMADFGSATTTYMDGLLKFDKTSWQMLAKEMVFADVWGTKIFDWDTTQDDWKQSMATALTDTLIRTGADEAAKIAQKAYGEYSNAISLASDWGYDAIRETLGEGLVLAFKYGGLEEGDKAFRRRLAQKCAMFRNPDNADFVKGLGDKVGKGLTAVSIVAGMAGNVAAFDTRDKTAVEGWDTFIAMSDTLNLDSVCRSAMDKRMEDYRAGTATQALGQYIRDNWFSTMADVLSVSNPLLVLYQLGSSLVPALNRELDREKNFQISMVAIPLEYDAKDTLEGVLDGMNLFDATSTQLGDAFRMAYFYLKSCYTAASLGASALGESIGGQDHILELMAEMVNCCDDADNLPDNLKTRAGYLTGGGYNGKVLALVWPLYEQVKGNVVNHAKNDEPVDDAECRVTSEVMGVKTEAGTFSGTPGGSYDVNIPLCEPAGILPNNGEVQGKLAMSFTSPTVPGSDTVEPDFETGGYVQAKTAYLGKFDWYTYIRDELEPQMGYADMNDMTRTVSNDTVFDSIAWNQRRGILGADVLDITGDDNDDMVLYTLEPVKNSNNPDKIPYASYATLYTEDGGRVTQHETLELGSMSGTSYDVDEVGILEVDGKPYVWHSAVGSAYFADGAGMSGEFLGWDGSAFRRFWWVGKSAGGSSGIAYSFRTYQDAENFTEEVLYGDEEYFYYEGQGKTGAGAQTYAEAMKMGYAKLGLPEAEMLTWPDANFYEYPSYWKMSVLKQSVFLIVSGPGDYRGRNIRDHVEDLTRMREKIDALP